MNKIILLLPKLSSRGMAVAAVHAAYAFQEERPNASSAEVNIDGCRTPFQVFVNDERVLVRPANADS